MRVRFHSFEDTRQRTSNNEILESDPNSTCEYVCDLGIVYFSREIRISVIDDVLRLRNQVCQANIT